MVAKTLSHRHTDFLEHYQGERYMYVDKPLKASMSTPFTSFFSMFNVSVHTQVKCADGGACMVVWMPDTVYPFGLKTGGTAQGALEQISSRGCAIPYQLAGRPVVKVGVRFDAGTRMPVDWLIAR